MKKLLLLVILIIGIITFCCCSIMETSGIEVCKEESMLIDYYEENGTVHIVCKIEVVNNFSTDQVIKITGVSQEDVEGGLLVESQLTGINRADQSNTFRIKARSSDELIVDFCGEYAGVLKKVDRRIPDIIEIEILE